MDGVSGEILYASLALKQFGLTDATLQESCFRIYNDRLIDHCAHIPDRLFGVGTISTYRIENAVRWARSSSPQKRRHAWRHDLAGPSS